MPETEIDIDLIIAEHGSYYKKGSQNEKSLNRKMYRSEQVTEKEMCTVMMTDDTVVDTAETYMTQVTQSYQADWTPTGKFTMTPRKLVLNEMKTDLEVYTRALRNSWGAFLDQNELEEKDCPLVKYLLENEVIEKKNEEFETEQIYLGVFTTPTPGTPGTAAQAFDGIRKRLNTHIGLGSIPTISTGALETDPVLFVKQVIEFCKDMPKQFWTKSMKIAMNLDQHFIYEQGVEELYNKYYVSQNGLSKVKGFKHTVIGLPSMGTDDKLWATMPGNLRLYVKNAGNEGRFKITSNKARYAQIYNQYYKGLDFVDHRLVMTNDRSLV